MRTSLRRSLPLAAAAVAAAALTACSSTSSSTAAPVTGTETLSATVTGQAAAANLNSSSNAPLSFATGTLTGPVAGTIKPFILGGGNGCKGTVTWITSAGPLTVNHAASPCPNPDAPPPATWTKSGITCHFTADFSAGTFRQASGLFTATTWHGTYKVTAEGYAPLLKGKTACGFSTTGNVAADGASIVFSASGPLVKG
jgi:hypothetical protein